MLEELRIDKGNVSVNLPLKLFQPFQSFKQPVSQTDIVPILFSVNFHQTNPLSHRFPELLHRELTRSIKRQNLFASQFLFLAASRPLTHYFQQSLPTALQRQFSQQIKTHPLQMLPQILRMKTVMTQLQFLLFCKFFQIL